MLQYASIDNIFVLGKRLDTTLQFHGVSYVIWQLVSQLVFAIFISNNHVSFHLL